MATKDFVTFNPNSGNKNQTISVTTGATGGGLRTTSLNISAKGITKTISITQQGGKVSLLYSSGQLEGFDPSMPAYTSGPFKPTVPTAEVQILPKSQSSISTNCIRLQLRPSVPVGDWVRGDLTLNADKVINAGVSPTPWDWEGAPQGAFVSLSGPTDVNVTFSGTHNLLDLTRYWWVPVTADGQYGFIISVL